MLWWNCSLGVVAALVIVVLVVANVCLLVLEHIKQVEYSVLIARILLETEELWHGQVQDVVERLMIVINIVQR